MKPFSPHIHSRFALKMGLFLALWLGCAVLVQGQNAIINWTLNNGTSGNCGTFTPDQPIVSNISGAVTTRDNCATTTGITCSTSGTPAAFYTNATAGLAFRNIAGTNETAWQTFIFQLSGSELAQLRQFQVFFQFRRNSTANSPSLEIAYSTDGTNYSSATLLFPPYPTANTWQGYLIDWSGETALNGHNLANLYIRIQYSHSSATSTRNIDIDNFQVKGTILNCTGTPSPGNTISSINPVCANSPFTLSLQNTTPGTGVTYQWQYSEDGNTWDSFTPSSLTLINTDFASTPASTNVYGNASISGGELILTPATGSQTGGFVIQTTPGANITPFSASFDYRIWDGSGADGMSLSYGPDMNNNAGGGEAGEGSGIIVSLDTYDNNTGTTNSQIRIYYAGVQVWNNSVGAYDLRNNLYRNVEMIVENNGYLALSIGGTSIVSGLLLTGYAAADKTNWKFKLSGRTGGLNDKHSVDNLVIKLGDFPTLLTSQDDVTYYRCHVTCSGNTGTSTPLQVNIKPTFNVAYTDVSCFNASNGTITISDVTGGTAPYEYSIYNGNTGTYQSSNVFTGLAPGTYKVRVKDATGCESPVCP